MKIERIRLRNFRAFREVDLQDLPAFAVFVGANGTGKTTLFSVFQFLHDALTSNVTVALQKLGGSRGFQEVRSRGTTGPIENSTLAPNDSWQHKANILLLRALYR